MVDTTIVVRPLLGLFRKKDHPWYMCFIDFAESSTKPSYELLYEPRWRCRRESSPSSNHSSTACGHVFIRLDGGKWSDVFDVEYGPRFGNGACLRHSFLVFCVHYTVGHAACREKLSLADAVIMQTQHGATSTEKRGVGGSGTKT